MSLAFSSLPARSIKPSLRICQTSVRYAGRDAPAGDPRKEILRRVLYPSNLRNKSTPTGTWRSDVGRALQHAIPSVQAHETIERAWLLHQRHVRRKREAELQRKFEKMKEAMDELYKLDNHLYIEANRPEDPRARSAKELELVKGLRGSERKAMEARIRGLFPRELRVPTDTPSRLGWNYDWQPIRPTSPS
ncbi:hypothetical protein GLOTRDRAFT_52048 [Gloeophyllum trabeum ATCC 11539]|uniref:Large ribosomal subunit protein mL40 n=1 Tax=Gloeophyllum trabeum (strain ATCC 11539 / FP-39264 / Madison 617) TaxID=670483 RepID=S7QLC6_GLOTA|nr:uncharacterized protein GLOTRDRAFT_52048 [Gloeophyllum trabeum ATCC 11539]EPQ60143.1 hypothetical protein GLOTRDRAFT_52048 [Gloeophyllum trabeum ATCC 11539]